MTSEVIDTSRYGAKTGQMTAYAMAHIRSIDQNAEVVEYLLKIDATLQAYGGRFLVHGEVPEVLDGDFPGVIVVIEFPDVDAARRWYASDGYQEIADFRIRNSEGGAFVVDGVGPDYRAASFVEQLTAG